MKSSKISELLEKINRTARDADFSNWSKLEIDLLKQHLRDLYSELDIVTSIATDVKTGSNRTLNPNKNVLLDEPAEEKETVSKENDSKELPVIAKAAAEKTPVKAEQVFKSSINESVQHAGSMNEKVKTSSKEVHKKLSAKPLKDLIDLNKKFILLNELFKGNTEAYSAAIHHIDRAEDFAAAEIFIKTELHTNYFWDESSQSVRMFMKLVKQKYGEE